MSRASFRQAWQAAAREGGMDPRIHYWSWEDDGRRLRVRPGRAAEQARRIAAAAETSGVEIEVLATEEAHVVSASWSSLRAEPRHEAEQISQLRLGQAFSVWARDEAGLWCLGAGEDGYPGWLRAWHLVPGSPPEADQVLVARQGLAREEPRQNAAVLLDLSFGTRLAATGPQRDGFLPWRLPDGRPAWTAREGLESLRTVTAKPRDRVLAWAPRLVGIPYEWGGTSVRGFDCSGLVQTLLAAAGRLLPRDADLQARQCRPRDTGSLLSWRPGDLLFFGEERIDHVALLLAGDRLLHASGEVRIEVLDPNYWPGGRRLHQVCEAFDLGPHQ